MLANQSGSYEPIPNGTHLAICYLIVGLGKQRGEYQGKARISPKIKIGFVIPSIKNDRGEPRVLSKKYTASLDPKSNLSKHLETWRAMKMAPLEIKTYDIFERIGKPAHILTLETPMQDGNIRSVITAINKVPDGTVIPNVPLAFVRYDIEEGRNENFYKLSKWEQEEIMRSIEFSSGPNAASPAPGPTQSQPQPATASGYEPPEEDDVPF